MQRGWLQSGDITKTAAFREGRVRIAGRRIATGWRDCGHAAEGPGPERILDCCAAPGGKTLILAERNPAAHIVACE